MRIAEVEVRPAERLVIGPAATVALEPLVMALFVELAQHAGVTVPRRQLFARLWGTQPVGDESLNRLAAVLRRQLAKVGAESLRIETVPASGYLLKLVAPAGGSGAEHSAQAIEEAVESWRLGLPSADHLRIALLTRAAELDASARIYGLLALHHRHAAEYGEVERLPLHLADCERAARRALMLDPSQPEALTALVSVRPLYGGWNDAHVRLREICDEAGHHPVPSHDLAVLEMATGQVEAATRRRERLSAHDPLAAIFAYKAVYQYWSLGQQTAMDHAADQAMQLWPYHPAVWTARFWTLIYSNRLPAAEAMTRHPPIGMPAPLMAFLSQVAQDLRAGHAEGLRDSARKLAGSGPSQAITALFLLGALGAVDDSFEIAHRYFLLSQADPVPIRGGHDHPRVNEQNRRLTQILFTPAAAAMRADRRFEELASQIGLEDFWRKAEIIPDYRRK